MTGEMAIRMLLDGDQAGLTRLANRLSDIIHNRVECPYCGSHGPHDDNGATGEDFALLCDSCHEIWEPNT